MEDSAGLGVALPFATLDSLLLFKSDFFFDPFFFFFFDGNFFDSFAPPS